MLVRFWSIWLIVLVVALIATAVCASDGLGYALVLVPFPTLLIAALIFPWLTPWLSVEAAWVTLVATSWAVMTAGLVWFGIGFAAGFTTFVYGVVARGLLALYFRRARRRNHHPRNSRHE